MREKQANKLTNILYRVPENQTSVDGLAEMTAYC